MMKESRQILAVGEEFSIDRSIWRVLEERGYEVVIAGDAERAEERLKSRPFDVLLVDITVSAMEKLGLLRVAKGINSDIAVIIASADKTVASVVNAIKAGAVDYLEEPIEADGLINVINEAFERQRASQELCLHIEEPQKLSYGGIISRSARMQQIFELIERLADVDSPVLITGETGVGKELVARAIHFSGARKDMPFVAINCGALTETLLESELFGHERGAFTGAFKTKAGKFECAHKGTLFLDEVGDVSPGMQVKLLRALQEKKVERVGGTHTIDVDVRIISATNQNIREKIASHEFRLDLFYRLNVVSVHVPPLRERPEDIPLLAEHFLRHLNKGNDRKLEKITPRAMRQLMDYHWPGNVRELENVVERTFITSNSKFVDHFTFPQYHESQPLASPGSAQEPETVNTDVPFSAARSRVLKNFEIAYLSEALKKHQGNISKTAQKTGINPRTLWRKLKEYGLDRTNFTGNS